VRNALVVNAEFSMRDGGYINPHAFRVGKTSDLHFLFPSYTLGEGATATVLQKSADGGESMSFQFSSRPDLAELCVMPTEGFRGRCEPTEKMSDCRPHRFSSFGADLFREAVPEMQKLVRAAKVEHDAVKAISTHSATHRSWVRGFEAFGLADKMFSIYPEFGNIAAASIPAAIATAVQRGVVGTGDALVACVASAGMSFSLCKFTL
jgi:3-oxoacyl-[acyl-carrier-protein] synthase III